MKIQRLKYLGLLLLFSTWIKAEILVIQKWQPSYELQPFSAIAEDTEIDIHSNNIKEQFTKLNFQPFQQYNSKTKTHQYYWGIIQLQNNLPNAANYTEWVMELTGSWTDLDAYVQQADGTFKKFKSGIFVSYKEKEFVPEIEGNYFKLLLPPQQTITIYFRGKGERGFSPPSFYGKLEHSDTYYKRLTSRRSSHALFTGFIVMMLLYNLIYFFILRDKSYLYYSIYLLTLTIYTSFVSGDLAEWFEPILTPNHPQYMYFGKIAIYLGLMAYIAFIRNFLELKILLPKWDKYFNILFWLGIPWIITDLILMFSTNFSYLVCDSLTLVYISIFIISNLFFSYYLYQTKDKKGYFIIIGIMAICLGIFLTSLEWGISFGFSMIYSKIGAIIEIIAFSLGLAYRNWENQKAKQVARYELEKNKMNQKQAQAEALRVKELAQLKTDFYTNITHEFRTPLTVIMGMNDNIQGNEKEKQLIKRNSNNLLQLINQLLDLSKAESGNLTMNNEQGDIVSYLQYLTESFYSMATDKGIRLTFYSEEKSLIMDFDEKKIQHIIYNLLSNALKFTQENGKVILHLQKSDYNGLPHVKIKVKDTGIGIPQEAIPNLFDRFFQIKNTHSKSESGTGIGLTLTKELIQLMDGKIEVESVEGEGTDFMIWLPIKNEAPTKKAISKNKIEILEHNRISTSEQLDLSMADNNNAITDKPILLIIEDNLDVATYIHSILKEKYQIHFAKNGQIGIEKAIEIIPDIIISDVMMPIKDGYEVCETLATDERTSHIPIILLTAKATQDDKIKGLKYGADAYLTKPFHKDELLVRLEKLVAIRQKLQQRYAQFKVNEEIKPASKNLSLEDDFLEKLTSIVTQNFQNPEFGVTELNQLMHMSKMQVYRKIKALTGKTPSVFIRNIRLQKGKELLENSNLTVSEIAYDIGFSDPSYFSRTFQQTFGKSPNSIRK